MNNPMPAPNPTPPAASPLGTRRLSLPWDLAEWIPREQLWQWTLEEVGSLKWDEPELVTFLERRPDYHPRFLLCLLGYAYCLGVFEDGEVADLGFSDPQLRTLAAAGAPRPREVSEFRKANRGLIKWVLVQVFRRALGSRFQLEGPLRAAGLKRYLVRAASARLDLARTMVRATEEA